MQQSWAHHGAVSTVANSSRDERLPFALHVPGYQIIFPISRASPRGRASKHLEGDKLSLDFLELVNFFTARCEAKRWNAPGRRLQTSRSCPCAPPENVSGRVGAGKETDNVHRVRQYRCASTKPLGAQIHHLRSRPQDILGSMHYTYVARRQLMRYMTNPQQVFFSTRILSTRANVHHSGHNRPTTRSPRNDGVWT